MNKDDTVVGNITIHVGTQYPGRDKRGAYPYRSVEKAFEHPMASMEKKPSNRRSPDEVRVTVEARETVNASGAIDVRNIQWIAKRDTHCKIVNCSHLAGIIKKMLFVQPSLFNPLYRVLFMSLQNEAVTRFYITATGVDRSRKKELRTFIKVKVLDKEFILPGSFLEDCRKAFLKHLPRAPA